MDTYLNDEMYQEMLADFLDESSQLLDRLNENLLTLEEWVRSHPPASGNQFDLETLNEMFRAAHSLKGLSAMLNLADINQLTHKLENVFDAARKNELAISDTAVEVMFQAADRLRAMVTRLRTRQSPGVDAADVIAAMADLLEKRESPLSDNTSDELAPLAADTEAALEVIDQALQQLAECDDANPAGTTAFGADRAENACRLPPDAVAGGAVSLSPSAKSESVLLAEAHAQFRDVTDEADPESKYLGLFLDELAQGLDFLTETLLSAEGGGTAEELENLLATVHRIKGSAASVGFHRASKLAHLMEDILQSLRDSAQPLTAELNDVLLNCTDGFRTFLDQLRAGQTPDADFVRPAARLLAVAQSLSQASSPPPLAANPASVSTSSTGSTACTNSMASAASDKTRLEGGKSGPEDGRRGRDGHDEAEAFPQENTSGALEDGERSVATQKREANPAVAASRATTGSQQAADGCLANALADGEVAELGTSPRPAEAAGEPQAGAEGSDCWPAEELMHKARQLAQGPVVIGRVNLQTGLKLSGLKARLLHEKLSHLGTLLYFHPPLSDAENPPDVDVLEFVLDTVQPVQAVEQALRVGGVQRVFVQQVRRTGVSRQSDGLASAAQARTADTVAHPSPGETPANLCEVNSADENPATGAAKTRCSTEVAKSVETLRVDIERLDQLMNLAGQLVITRARLTELSDKLKSHFHNNRAGQILRGTREFLARLTQHEMTDDVDGTLRLDRLVADRLEKDFELLVRELEALAGARSAVNSLGEAVHQLERVTDGIQRAVMETRMVPIGPLFHRFKRVIRDVTRQNGKRIQLVILGEKTELDKRMIDELGDPLIHLVRNAADHGIEDPAVRQQRGKPEIGTVTLNAFHRGNSIIIQVSDDGQGLDAEKIAKKALDRHLINPSQAQRMSRQEIAQLIFLPGLSTAEKVTEVSGRGMGMDIVKSKIEELSGSIELESTPGAGTTVTIKLPLTLAILPSLLVTVDGEVFAMPIETVKAIVAARPENLVTIHGVKTARIRDRVISVVELSEVFASSSYRPPRLGTNSQVTTLVIVGDNEHELGLVVDEVLGEEDVVIKSIAENYRNIPGIAGASILGDGRVSLILDVTAILVNVMRRGASRVT